jgi:outer membrane cobalamin receptor
MLRIFGVFLALLNCAAAQQSQANKQGSSTPASATAAPQQQTVIVTGTYEPAPLQESDRDVVVLDQLSQSDLLFRNWADVLRLDASVDLRQRQPGVQGDLSIRGSTVGQTLVLVDGLRVNDAQSEHHNLDLPIPFESIKRIELLHGSGSTFYGSDAVGGAVNFITAAPVATQITLGAGAGNFGTNTEFGSASYLANKWSEQIAFTRDFSTGFMPDRDYRTFAASSETRFATSLGSSDILLGLSDRPFGANEFYGDFNSWERTKGWFAGLSQQLGANTQFDLGYRRHTDQFILLRDMPQVYENNHVTESWQAALRKRHGFTPNDHLYYGLEFFRDSIDSNNLGHHARDRGALYVAFDARAIRRLSLSIGGREEAFSQGHPVFSPNIAAGYALSSRWRLRGSIAHAYRLPTYTDLYYSDPANIGNPNLRPETAWSYEGGLEYTASSRLAGTATLFHSRQHEVIDYARSSPTSIYQAVNIQNLRFTGLELLARLRVGESQQLDIGYTTIYGEQDSLVGLQSKYALNYPVNQATLGWMGTAPGELRLRTRIGVTDRYASGGPYPLIEVAATRQFHWLEPYAQVTNVTNTGYVEIPGVRMPGRAFVAGLQLVWSLPHPSSP